MLENHSKTRMSKPEFPTRVEARAGRTMSPAEIFDVANRREKGLSRLLVAYISTGLVFMLLPGTFLGVWNLISISSRRASEGVSPAWIQAHGHAQVFGWIGSFILGIGFYSIPKLRRLEPFALGPAWICWAMWTSAVALRWTANVYGTYWRALLPLSATLELAALVLFFRAVSTHRMQSGETTDQRWVMIVMAGTAGLVAALGMNLFESVRLALSGSGPAFPPEFDQRLLAVVAWGFMVPFVWGFSTKWLPVFLGLRPTKIRLMLSGTVLNMVGVISAIVGHVRAAAAIWIAASATAAIALQIFRRSAQPAKTKGVHQTFPVFVRIAYVWLLVAGGLAVWASLLSEVTGIWGASRHALTVGFIAMMVFCVGQRVLPAFAGMKSLWSPSLMFIATSLLAAGCFLRVSCEVLAYQGYASWAWNVLPISAVTELVAVTVFAANISVSFARRSSAQPVVQVSAKQSV
jgi:uncharacterized protein involved in response to NO